MRWDVWFCIYQEINWKNKIDDTYNSLTVLMISILRLWNKIMFHLLFVYSMVSALRIICQDHYILFRSDDCIFRALPNHSLRINVNAKKKDSFSAAIFKELSKSLKIFCDESVRFWIFHKKWFVKTNLWYLKFFKGFNDYYIAF